MGSYTPNLKLFLPGDNDYVDVTADVANNMNIIDEAVYEACAISMNDSSWGNQNVPSYRNKHALSTWNGGVRTWDEYANNQTYSTNWWQPTHGDPQEWTSMTSLLSGWTEVSGYKAYYRYSKEDQSSSDNYTHLELRGRLMLGTNYSPIVQNQVYQFTNFFPGPPYFPEIPNSGFGSSSRVTMGNSPSSSTIWNDGYITMASQGVVGVTGVANFALQFFRKCGTAATNAQTAGNTENYFCMDNVKIPLAYQAGN